MIIIIRFGIEPGLNKTIIATVSNNFMFDEYQKNKEEFGFLNGFTFFFLFFFNLKHTLYNLFI